MLTTLRAFIYNINETYKLLNQLKVTLKDKSKSRVDLIPILDKMTIKLKVLHDDTVVLINRFFPVEKEDKIRVAKYFPEYKEVRERAEKWHQQAKE